MKTTIDYKKQERSPSITPRSVAKDFILSYLLKKNTAGLFRIKRSLIVKKNYSLKLKGKGGPAFSRRYSIVVVKFYGVKIHEIFSLNTLINETSHENYRRISMSSLKIMRKSD